MGITPEDAWFAGDEDRIALDPSLVAEGQKSSGNCSSAAASSPQLEDGVTFAHNIIMNGGWHNGSKTRSFGLPFGIASALVTAWFFMSGLHGQVPSIGASVGSAATQSVALLSSDDDVDAVDSGVQDRGWSAESSARKPDPAANPFLDSTPIHLARRTLHRQQRANHHQKIVHHHH